MFSSHASFYSLFSALFLSPPTSLLFFPHLLFPHLLFPYLFSALPPVLPFNPLFDHLLLNIFSSPPVVRRRYSMRISSHTFIDFYSTPSFLVSPLITLLLLSSPSFLHLLPCPVSSHHFLLLLLFSSLLPFYCIFFHSPLSHLISSPSLSSHIPLLRSTHLSLCLRSFFFFYITFQSPPLPLHQLYSCFC